VEGLRQITGVKITLIKSADLPKKERRFGGGEKKPKTSCGTGGLSLPISKKEEIKYRVLRKKKKRCPENG